MCGCVETRCSLRTVALRGNTSDEIALFYYSLSLAREEEEHRGLIRFSAVVR